LPETLLLRELRFFTPQRGHRTRVITLVTTLLDPIAYPATALAKLYLGRWQIEVNFRHLKTTMGLEVLHCKTVAGVLKEMYMFAITYNLVRLVMLEASRRQKVPLDRIGFIDALRWLRDAKTDTHLTALVVNPARPDRLEPRVLKRRMKEYDLMKKPRQELRKALLRKKGAA
ncbi:MAG: transposase, partial [Gemmataceae bacterium]